MSHWNDTHAHYAIFALLPLQTAVLTQQEDYTLYGFNSVFTSHHPVTKAKLDSLVKTLTWDDSDYFTMDELRFFCTLRNRQGIGFRSEDVIKRERERLQTAVKYLTPHLSIEAGYLLKAMDFWELRHKDKKEEWGENFRKAYGKECEREAWKARREMDEGYHSSDEEED